MPVNAAALAQAIVDEFPGDWGWDAGRPNRSWLEAICASFQTMWTTGVLSPGLGPPPTALYPHIHSITFAPFTGTLYTPEAIAFVTNIGTVLASNLAAVITVIQDGSAPHSHAPFTWPPAAALSAAIVSGGGASGVGIQPFADGFAAGLLSHLQSNAGITALEAGALHIHTLL